MRILFYNERTGIRGGTETYINLLKKSLEERGHQVEIMEIDIRNHYDFKGSQPDNFMKFKIGFFYVKEVGAIIKKKMAEFRPDVVHLNNNAYFTKTILTACKQSNLPVFQTIHDYRLIPKVDESLLAVLIKRLRFAMVRRNITNFICPSKIFFDLLQERKISNTTYVPYFLETEHWELTEKVRKKQILYVGRLEIVKGIFTLVDAFRKVADEFPDHKLLFMGEGGEDKNLAQAIKDNNLSNQVELYPFQPQQVIRDYLLSSELIVVPSAYREMFGLIGLESFACKIPVIASNVAGIPEWCIHEKTGLLFEMNDADGLATCMRRLLKDKQFADSLSEGGFQFLEDFNNKDRSAKILEDTYNRYI